MAKLTSLSALMRLQETKLQDGTGKYNMTENLQETGKNDIKVTENVQKTCRKEVDYAAYTEGISVQ